MDLKQKSLRNFLRRMAYASAGTLSMPGILSSCSKRTNDHFLIAHIGFGSRGTSTIRNYFLPVPYCRSDL